VADVLVIGAGEVVPVEARLEEAAAVFSLASINGEAEPRAFRAGQRVPGGAVSLARGDVRLTAQQAWPESLLAQLLAPAARSGWRQVFLERIVRGYLLGILGIAFLAGLGWWRATGDAARAWSVVTSVLVVSCPCAIGLAFPLADEMATVALRRRGVFVRDGDLWAKLGRVRKLVFDKTGTLTLEHPVLQNPEALQALAPAAQAALLTLVRDNPHPVGQCLAEPLLADGTVVPAEGTVRETIGCGLELLAADGSSWTLGRPGWKSGHEERAGNAGDDAVVANGEVVLAREGEVVARFRMKDTPRPDARGEIVALTARGLEVTILSGDAAAKVRALAAEVGIPEGAARGGQTPQDKADWIAAHGADDVLMLGDGANDSLAFDRALCCGTPVIHRGLLERKADFYYLGRGIGGIRALFETDAVRRRTQRAILVFSVAYNLTVVGLAVAGRVNPLVAAVLMPVSSLTTLAIVGLGMRPVWAKTS
jgi:Cu2+-exporting ATPase